MEKQEVRKKIEILNVRRKMTGIEPEDLAKDRTDLPKSLSGSRLNDIFSGAVDDLKENEYQAALGLYEGLPVKDKDGQTYLVCE